MKSEFMLAINQLCAERRLSPDVVLEAVEAALISAYKRNFGATTNIEVRIEPNSGRVVVYAVREVVETVEDPKSEVTLREAREIDPQAELGGQVLIENTPREFGRIAAQTAKQVILQRIREAERDALFTTFVDRAGEIAHGTIQSIDFHSRDVVVNLDGAEAVLPAREQVPSERYRRGGRLRAFVLEVRRGSRGPQITLSRRTPDLLKRLLELEVPEVSNGSVEIRGIAREAGSRSKVAVYATQDGVDPVGSCVGVRGQRIQSVVNELNGEKIDVVQWSPELATFVANALSPAKVMNVLLVDSPETGKTATVIVPDRQLSLAIGKEGQNARLAAKLTGWRIDIKSVTEAAEETLGRLEDLDMEPGEMDLMTLAEVLLRKRGAEGLTEEERAVIEAQMQTMAEELAAAQAVPSIVEPPAPESKTEEEAEPPVVAEPSAEEEAIVVGEAEIEREVAATEPLMAAEEAESALPETEQVPEEELVPTFEGEPVEESLGWVVTETQEDLYAGWDDYVAEAEDLDLEELWEREELEEISDRPGAPGDGKRKKKGGKSRYGRGRDR
jgi:N utilization substance protein A